LYLVKKESNLINKFLATLTKHINAIERSGLIESKVELSILWRKLACIWINCPNFQNYDNIVILIKVICNLIMIEVNNEI
jgi:hypothetical protein